MKTILYLFLLVVPVLSLSGQNHNFKSKPKNPPGTTAPGFNFTAISPVSGSKSATGNKSAISQTLSYSDLKLRRKISIK